MPTQLPNLTRIGLPYSTRSPYIDALDFANIYRIRDLDPQIHWLNQDDGTFFKVLSMLSNDAAATQPIYYWIEANMLPISTTINLANGYSATDTTLHIVDPLCFIASHGIAIPSTGELLLVQSVDIANSNIVVQRGFMGSPRSAIANGTVLRGIGPQLAEKADALGGNGSVPGASQFNYVSRVSQTVQVTHMQEYAAMIDGVGQIEWDVVNTALAVKRQINAALIHNQRGTQETADGTMYMSDGFLNRVQDNVLNCGDVNGVLSWKVLNDFLYPLFVATNASPVKTVFCGAALFEAFCNLGRELNPNQATYYTPEINSDFGAMAITLKTNQGGELQILRDKFGFPVEDGMGGWGIIVDMAYCQLKEYTNEPLVWRRDIQLPQSHVRKDEIWGSFSLKLMHPSMHGFIRGAQNLTVTR